MELFKKRKTFLLLPSAVVIISLILTETFFASFNKGAFRVYESSIIEPLSYSALGLLLSILLLFFFSEVVYKNWLKNILVWFIPVAFLVTASGSTGSWVSRSDLAALMGGILVGITLVYALVQRFYYKR